MPTTTLLGKTISPIGIGTWAWGDKLFWGYGDRYGQKEVEAAFQTAIESGITLFDTAEVYGLGESERLIGQFAKTVPKDIQIATKYGPLPWRLTKEAVHQAINNSRQRLQVDTIDLYQVHWPFSFFMSQETLCEALAEAVSKGWIRAVGVSNYDIDQMQQAHDSLARWSIPLAVNQVRYSLITRQIEIQGLLERAQRLGIIILAYSPLAQGLLTGKYTPRTKPHGARSIDPRFSPKGLTKLTPVLNSLRRAATAHQKTMAQVALNWLLQQDGIIPIPGAKTAKQAQENAGAMGWSLTPDELKHLKIASQSWMQ